MAGSCCTPLIRYGGDLSFVGNGSRRVSLDQGATDGRVLSSAGCFLLVLEGSNTGQDVAAIGGVHRESVLSPSC